MNGKRVFSIVLAVALTITAINPCYAATTQDKLNDARAAKDKTESSLNDTKNKIDNLQAKKSESESYMEELNSQLEELKNSLIKLQEDSEAKQAELVKVQGELADAKAREEKQYEDMKLRIQFMYEKSSAGYLEMLFSASDFAEFLNRAENISQISEYDRDMLITYEKTKEEIADKEKAVQKEKAAIEELQKQSAEKQGEVEEVVANTYNEISAYAADIKNAESEEASLLAKVNAQEDSINGLLKQAKEEQIAAQKAEAEAAAKAKAQQEAKAETKAEAKEETSSKEEPSSDSKKEEAAPQEKADDSDSQAEQQKEEPEEAQEAPAEEKQESSSGGTYLGTFKLTAYCNCSKCCGQWAGGGTASGTTPTPGRTVAMGGIPFGTKLLINGNVYTVEDRGTAYGHVDIYMGSHSAALNFGLQYAEVYQVN